MTGDALVLALRLAFVLLLYLFLFNLVAALRRDLARSARPPEAVADRAASPPGDGRLIVLNGGSSGMESGRSIPLGPEVIIGRAPDSHVRLSDSLVSARHARLRRHDGRWYIEDLNSTNGTLLNQQPLRGEKVIEYGDTIAIADVRLKLAR